MPHYDLMGNMPRNPTIAISGPGGSGKDTMAEMFVRFFGMKYQSSTSYCARDYVYGQWCKEHGYEKYLSPESMYEDRRNQREFWAAAIDKMNRTDPAMLYKICLGSQDILTGIRKTREFEAVKAANLCDLYIWIETFPLETKDPTQEYGPELCDIVIHNEMGNLKRMEQSVKNLYRFFNAFREKRVQRPSA